MKKFFQGSEGSLGVGQTWQDMTSSRALNQNYTNDTGRPIQLSVGVLSTDGTVGYVYINDVIVGYSIGHSATTGTQTVYGSIQVVVPAGDTYKVTGGALGAWGELR